VKVLLWIKDWDFNWQDTYIFKDLVTLPKGTRIDGELIYDNSANNFRNPNSPPRLVTWGENSTDEMGSLLLNVVPVKQADSQTLRTALLVYSLTTLPAVGSKPLFISSGVVDGASAKSAPVSPGKVVVLYGNRMGPANLTSGQVANGKLAAEAGGTQVLFDGVPAPVLYSSAGQVAALVPYSVEGKAGTQIVVKNGANTSDPVPLTVVPAAPAIFSADTSGTGQGVILNSDLSVNSSSKPAAKGSVIVIYATGEGQTLPAGVDGQLANGPTYAKPLNNVSVTVGGQPAEVLYAGAAPQLVAGVMQINVRVPNGVQAGDVPPERL